MSRTVFRFRGLAWLSLRWLLAVGFVHASPQAFAGFNVYTVGGDAACGFAFIQDAIDAAASHPGEDYVFIATNRTYESQHLQVTDQDVDIVGGFPDCTQLGDPGIVQTTIGGTSGHSVFEIEGNSHVYMSNLIITGAVMDESHNGGGIYFGGAGGVTLRYSWVFSNQAGYGGGIAMSPSGPSTLDLIASTVSANTALVSGGGIRIEGPTTLNAFSTATDNIYIAQNTALGNGATAYGGGIEVLGPAIANVGVVVDLNNAAYGGGIAAVGTDQGSAYVNLYTNTPASPVTIYGNTAQQSGGGVFLRSSGSNLAKLCAFDFAIDANSATYGGAIMAATDGDGNGSIAFLNSDGCDRPGDAVACAPGTACNEINDNIASTSDQNGAIHVGSASSFSASRFAARRNQGSSLIHFDADAQPSNGGDYVHLHDCLIVDNVLTGNLLYAYGGAAQTQVIVDTCTVANNTLPDNAYVLGADTNFAEVTNSIIYQPNQPSLIFFGPAGDLTARYILTNDTISFTGYTGIVDGAPVFVDAANGDYHQARTSPGVDFAPAIDGVDLDGNPRTLDLTDVPDQWGPLDVGAYELQTQATPPGCAVADTIFCDGFELP